MSSTFIPFPAKIQIWVQKLSELDSIDLQRCYRIHPQYFEWRSIYTKITSKISHNYMRLILGNTKYLLQKYRDRWKTNCYCPFIHAWAIGWNLDLPLVFSSIIVCWIFSYFPLLILFTCFWYSLPVFQPLPQ